MDVFGDLPEDNEDEYDYSDEDEWKDELDFQPEVDVYERVGLPGERLAGIEKMDDELGREILDPVERFTRQVNAISRNPNIQLSEEDTDILLSKISNISNINYKNPTGYVLGYIATRGGRNLDKKSVTNIFKYILPKLQESVEQPDVIRYGRYWQKI
jgi:hypothetical protein